MKWKKRLFCLLAVLGVCLSLIVPSLAEERFVYVYDEAGLLTVPERDALESQAADFSGEYDFAVYVVTVSDYRDYGGGTVDAVAASIFEKNDFGLGAEGSGVLLLLSMEERDYALFFHGYGNSAFTERDKDRLEEAFLDDFRRDDWYGGFSDFVSSCGGMLEQATAGDSSDRYTPYVNGDTHPSFFRGLRERLGPFGLMIVIVVFPALVALIVCTIAKRNMKSVKKAEKADFFAVPGSMELYASEDRFTHITQARVKVESDSDINRSGGGGGGGSSSRSGKF